MRSKNPEIRNNSTCKDPVARRAMSSSVCDQSHQSRCALCKERLRGVHSHPGQWKSDLQQLLQEHNPCIPLSACVCRADELSFFQNAWFISGTQEFPGTLADTIPGREEQGFLSFVRLVGTVYFKKHLAEFIHSTPRALYTSLTQSGLGPVQQYKLFIESIRDSVWSRIQFEDELPPSFDALWRHWLRTCWVSNMWSQALQNHMTLLDLTQYGWMVVEEKLECDWESAENQTAVRERVGLLFRGCSCSSVTACSSRRCSCVKKGIKCGPGCRCRNCSNAVSAAASAAWTQQQSIIEIEQEELQHDDSLRRECGEEWVPEENEELDDEDEFIACH